MISELVLSTCLRLSTSEAAALEYECCNLTFSPIEVHEVIKMVGWTVLLFHYIKKSCALLNDTAKPADLVVYLHFIRSLLYFW